jgi:ferritin-like metal-binding protein YciE
VKDEFASSSESLTQADDDLKCSINKLRADTQEQIENLDKKLKSTSERIPAEDTTIIIRDYKRASEEIKRTLDKFMSETKANIEALNIKDA